MSYQYFVVQVNTREQAKEVSHIFSEALPLARAKGKACFDIKMHIVSSEHELKSTHELLEDLIRDQSQLVRLICVMDAQSFRYGSFATVQHTTAAMSA